MKIWEWSKIINHEDMNSNMAVDIKGNLIRTHGR